MAKYDFTNEVSFNEQPLYKQGYEDAIEKACEFILESGHVRIGGITRKEFVEYFRKSMKE